MMRALGTLAMANGFLSSLADAVGRAPRGAEDLAGLSLSEASERIRSGTVTPTQLTQACLARIDVYGPKLDAFITVLRDQALLQASELENEQKVGKLRSPLHGIPIAIKDNIDTAGIRTTAASAVYDDRVPKEDAEVVRRLKAAGAILIGKTNLDEFAWGISYFGSVRNPWALDRDPSGSSSGSAAALAANLAFGALGTDTGGSIRTPSAYCGVVGLKPTYGLVPIRGIVPLALSLDHCGPMARTVDDIALILNEVAGYDKLDIASVEHAKEDYVAAMQQPVSSFRLGIPRAAFYDHLDSEISKAIEEAIGVLAKLTKSVKDVTLPPVSGYTWNAMNGLGAETYAYHQELLKMNAGRYMLATRLDLQDVKNWLNAAPDGCSARVTDYIRGRWDLALLRRAIDDQFTDFDLVVTPTMRLMPRKLSTLIQNLEHPKPHNPEDYLDINNDTPFNVFGLPAVSIPCGFSSDGMPIGLTVAGPHFSEGKVLALARAYERDTRWEVRRPVLSPDTPVPPIRPAEDNTM
jgi:aspartyl-tRNA(Asn)/glutamyl-tRNA(Gln) amidotransferase subunit A